MNRIAPDGGSLERTCAEGIATWNDGALRARTGVVVAFSERTGGASDAPYRSLNLAAHVSDDPVAVDENRRRLLVALGIGEWRERLTVAEQVHGIGIAEVDESIAGAGAYAAEGPGAVAQTDALITPVAGVPLLMCFADCVPIVLVAPGPVVAVAHAGWRGALRGLAGSTAQALAREARCAPEELLAYLGAHIGACHYEVGDDVMSHFFNTFGTVARASSGGLDLGAVVRHSLTDAGVPQWRITSLGMCTAEETERFYSYRAERGRTGRHGALVCISS